jgi:hypothetical protein
MGDDIRLEAIEVIQGGLLQIDFRNATTGQCYRLFAEPLDFFTKLGTTMSRNMIEWSFAEQAKRERKETDRER